jgi:hypothetical protein
MRVGSVLVFAAARMARIWVMSSMSRQARSAGSTTLIRTIPSPVGWEL